MQQKAEARGSKSKNPSSHVTGVSLGYTSAHTEPLKRWRRRVNLSPWGSSVLRSGVVRAVSNKTEEIAKAGFWVLGWEGNNESSRKSF